MLFYFGQLPLISPHNEQKAMPLISVLSLIILVKTFKLFENLIRIVNYKQK